MIYKQTAPPMPKPEALGYLKAHGATDPERLHEQLQRLTEAVTSGEAFTVFGTISKQTRTKAYLNLYAYHMPISDPDGVLGMVEAKETGRRYTFKCDSPTLERKHEAFSKLAYILEQTHGIRLDFSSLLIL